MSSELYCVDAFTSHPFAGNPAAVCLLTEPAEPGWMQRVAAEMNLSETAFVVPTAQGYGLRWFTPEVEVSLCGHATLASAHVLFETERLGPGAVARFHTQSGLLTAERIGDRIELSFPSLPPEPARASPGLVAALGVQPIYEGRAGPQHLLVLGSEEEVRGAAPDFAALVAEPGRGVVITARASDAGYDFVSRYFVPWVGIDEDPVTGSVHCILAPYWAAELGKTTLRAHQASRRGGDLELILRDERVRLRGHAVTVWRGELLA